MFEFRQSDDFTRWFSKLRDQRAKDRISVRLQRLRSGAPGDVKSFDGISELRIDYGPGYRIYYFRQGQTIILLLCGGDKSSQVRDIDRARTLAKEARNAD